MPGRVSRQTTTTPKPRTQRKKSQKKALDAYAIAGHAVKPSKKHQLARHRFGEVEGEAQNPSKRRRQDDDFDDTEDGGDGSDQDVGARGNGSHKRQRRNEAKATSSGGGDATTAEYFSDSEGNEWHTGGHIDAESDSEIDSDEAFGESDEDQFEGFSFRGSHSRAPAVAGRKKAGKPGKAHIRRGSDDDESVNLDEPESEEMDEDDDGLGDEAVDLATMLDDDYATDESTSNAGSGNEDDSGESAESATDMSDAESDTANPEKLAKLQDLVASLETELEDKKKSHNVLTGGTDSHEAQTPSAFGLTSSQKLRVADLLPTVKDAALRKSLKVLASSDKPSKKTGIPGKLEAPLSKRRQDQLNRAAATQKAKETLSRWRDTVIQNRRAEHLQFPLVDPDAQEPMGTRRMVAVQQDKPQTELEAAIQDILEASGMSSGRQDRQAGAVDGEALLQQAETLAANKLPVEEVMARRAELRRARELLFREEVRAKRVKKIKSRSYRRVHRKERERQRELEQGFLDPDGEGMDETEKDRHDRRRAEERMGAKHRESKWAKNMKQSGRTVWDDDARDGVIDMARRNEELRKRIEGKEANEDDGMSSAESFHTSDDDSENNDDEDDPAVRERRRLGKQVNHLAHDDDEKASTRLGNMAFMQRADAARKRQNDETIEDIRRELAEEAGEVQEQDKPDTQLGRRIFGPTSIEAVPKQRVVRSELEEGPRSDDEDADATGDIDVTGQRSGPEERQSTTAKAVPKNKKPNRPILSQTTKADDTGSDDEDNPWLTATTGNKKKSRSTASKDFVPSPASMQPVLPSNAPVKAGKAAKATPVPAKKIHNESQDNDDGSSDHDAPDAILSEREKQAMYHARAFAGDEAEIETSFANEKNDQTADQDDQYISTVMPGWGSWAGEGLTKSIRKQNTARKHNPLLKTKVDGVRPADRRDAKLENVIINEAGSRKGKKYLAAQLPHEFEKKAQYERSLRVPLGKEWTTKETFQKNTKPRVIVKQGVIAPMAKPMV